MQLWPPVVDPATLTRQVWDAVTARSIPAVGRAMGLYGGLISQCDLDRYAGDEKLDRTPLLELPDPTLKARSIFVRVHVEDYLVNGNALHLITARDPITKYPRAVRWFPASQWSIVIDQRYPGRPDYYLNGKKVFREDVVHVQWGADEGAPWRGVGIVERYLRTLDRVGMQEASESHALKHGSVPSVAVVTPQTQMDQVQADKIADRWEEKFGGSSRRPGIFPKGTEITPLSFSPQDQEATLARQMSLTDVANLLNLDPYWVGAPGSSHTYKSPGPMFLTLQRVSLEPVMTDLESVWSLSWTAPGEKTKFDRNQLTRDDFQTSILTLKAAVEAGLMTDQEARVYMGWSAVPTLGELRAPKPAAAAAPAVPELTVLPGGAEDETGATG